MSHLVGWLRRRQSAAAALLLYTLLAFAMMAPLAPKALPFTGARDIGNHVSGVVEARNALAEGQFPIRVAPQTERSSWFRRPGGRLRQHDLVAFTQQLATLFEAGMPLDRALSVLEELRPSLRVGPIRYDRRGSRKGATSDKDRQTGKEVPFLE